MTFECAINVTGYNLYIVANSSSVVFSIAQKPLPNGGVMLSLNLTAISEVNGTAVTCFTSNYATKPAYVYVQGQYNN